MKATAIIVAGGKGRRMNTATRKQYLSLAGRPVLIHTLRKFIYMDEIDAVCIVAPWTDMDYCESLISELPEFNKGVDLVAGGNERQDSVYNGLSWIKDRAGIVVIHDAVRPFVLPYHIEACIREAETSGACILGLPASDTLKNVTSDGTVHETINRDGIWLAQTPQAFAYPLIVKAHERAKADGFYGTDDASLVEYLGHPVKIISGSKYNIKITTKEDLLFAETLVKNMHGEIGR